MLKFYPERPRPAAFRVIGDVAAGAWTVLCLLLGRWLHDQIERLRQVGDALRGTGDEINSGIGQLNTGFGQLNEVLKAIKASPLSQLLNLHNPSALPTLARRGDQLIAAAGQLNTVVDQTALVVGVLVAAIPIFLITGPYAVWRCGTPASVAPLSPTWNARRPAVSPNRPARSSPSAPSARSPSPVSCA